MDGQAALGGLEWGLQRGTGGKRAGQGARSPIGRGGWGSEASTQEVALSLT